MIVGKKKLLMGFLALIALIANGCLGLQFTPEQTYSLVSVIIASIFGEAWVDVARAAEVAVNTPKKK